MYFIKVCAISQLFKNSLFTRYAITFSYFIYSSFSLLIDFVKVNLGALCFSLFTLLRHYNNLLVRNYCKHFTPSLRSYSFGNLFEYGHTGIWSGIILCTKPFLTFYYDIFFFNIQHCLENIWNRNKFFVHSLKLSEISNGRILL